MPPLTLRFNFLLRPLSDVMAWGKPPNQSLSWFGLTDGWFWIQAGDAELFRYSDIIHAHWAETYPLDRLSLPYEDYQVVRYWEDLLQMLPTVLDPVPSDIARRVVNAQKWEVYQKKVKSWQEAREADGDESAWEAVDKALRWWWGDRTWGAGHLAHPPSIWLWRQNNTVHLRWDNRDRFVDSLPVWQAEAGHITVSTAAFIRAVRDFDARLIAAMGERVAEIEAGCTRPDVALNVPALACEHIERATYFDNHLYRARTRDYEWNEVRKSLAFLDAQIGRK